MICIRQRRYGQVVAADWICNTSVVVTRGFGEIHQWPDVSYWQTVLELPLGKDVTGSDGQARK